MYIKTLICNVLFIISFTNVKAEEIPTLPIVDLSIIAEKIVIGNFIDKIDNRYLFEVKDFFAKAVKKDTIEILNIERLIYKPEETFRISDEIIIYVERQEGKRVIPVISGYRVLINKKILIPFQLEYHGIQEFFSSTIYYDSKSEGVSWDKLKKNIQQAFIKIKELQSLIAIKESKNKKEQLFKWIKKYKRSIGKRCGYNGNCGWGYIERKPFKVLVAEGNMQEVWKASELYRQTPLVYQRFRKNVLVTPSTQMFSSYDGVNFLLLKLFKNNTTTGRQQQALYYLKNAIEVFYEASNSTNSDQQKIACRDTLMPFLQDEKLNILAFNVIERLSVPEKNIYKNSTDLSLLPSLVDIYKKDSISSNFRLVLGKFIVKHLSKEEWKHISGNDQSILINMTLNHHALTIRNSLEIKVVNLHQCPNIKEPPSIILTNFDDNSIIKIPMPVYLLPFKNGKIWHTTYKGSKLTPGNWQIHLAGVAGERNEFIWHTDYIFIEKSKKGFIIKN